MKLCLGTVQFGLDYGLLSQKKPSLSSSVDCLDYATQNGIQAIDTAEAYGTAQEVVGTFLKKRTISRDKLFISSKLLPNTMDKCSPDEYESIIRQRLEKSLQTLHTDYLDAYLFHSARYVFQEELLAALAKMKEEGLVRQTGVSVYEPEEAMAGYRSSFVDFLQLPYSVFDHRMKTSGVFDSPLKRDCQIHSRSAFIQGLILMQPEQLSPFLSEAEPIIRRLEQISEDTGISRVALAIAYVKRETAISHLVFGVDTLEQLREDIALFEKELPSEIIERMDGTFAGINADIVMPSLWKK